MKNYDINVGDEVYVLIPPSGTEPYRYVKGIVTKIVDRDRLNSDNIKKITLDDSYNEKAYNKIRIRVVNIEDDTKWYLAPVYRVYSLESLQQLNIDIANYTKMKEYKAQLEELYYKYRAEQFPDWKPKHEVMF